jgi:hypothetical protein
LRARHRPACHLLFVKDFSLAGHGHWQTTDGKFALLQTTLDKSNQLTFPSFMRAAMLSMHSLPYPVRWVLVDACIELHETCNTVVHRDVLHGTNALLSFALRRDAHGGVRLFGCACATLAPSQPAGLPSQQWSGAFPPPLDTLPPATVFRLHGGGTDKLPVLGSFPRFALLQRFGEHSPTDDVLATRFLALDVDPATGFPLQPRTACTRQRIAHILAERICLPGRICADSLACFTKAAEAHSHSLPLASDDERRWIEVLSHNPTVSTLFALTSTDFPTVSRLSSSLPRLFCFLYDPSSAGKSVGTLPADTLALHRRVEAQLSAHAFAVAASTPASALVPATRRRKADSSSDTPPPPPPLRLPEHTATAPVASVATAAACSSSIVRITPAAAPLFQTPCAAGQQACERPLFNMVFPCAACHRVYHPICADRDWRERIPSLTRCARVKSAALSSCVLWSCVCSFACLLFCGSS